MANLIEIFLEDGFHHVRYNGRTYHKARNAEQAVIYSRQLAATVEASEQASGASSSHGVRAPGLWDTREMGAQTGTVVSYRAHVVPILHTLGIMV